MSRPHNNKLKELSFDDEFESPTLHTLPSHLSLDPSSYTPSFLPKYNAVAQCTNQPDRPFNNSQPEPALPRRAMRLQRLPAVFPALSSVAAGVHPSQPFNFGHGPQQTSVAQPQPHARSEYSGTLFNYSSESTSSAYEPTTHVTFSPQQTRFEASPILERDEDYRILSAECEAGCERCGEAQTGQDWGRVGRLRHAGGTYSRLAQRGFDIPTTAIDAPGSMSAALGDRLAFWDADFQPESEAGGKAFLGSLESEMSSRQSDPGLDKLQVRPIPLIQHHRPTSKTHLEFGDDAVNANDDRVGHGTLDHVPMSQGYNEGALTTINDEHEMGFADGSNIYGNSSPIGTANTSPGDCVASANSEHNDHNVVEHRTPKTTAINKDGTPRKPRAPRNPLIKWDDNDWKQAVLGIIWACGETGLSIPFGQAAQLVSQSCTASALQQAVLKLREKMNAEGHQIPGLRMVWTRDKRDAAEAFGSLELVEQPPKKTRLPRKKPTRMAGTQSLIVVLKYRRRPIPTHTAAHGERQFPALAEPLVPMDEVKFTTPSDGMGAIPTSEGYCGGFDFGPAGDDFAWAMMFPEGD